MIPPSSVTDVQPKKQSSKESKIVRGVLLRMGIGPVICIGNIEAMKPPTILAIFKNFKR